MSTHTDRLPPMRSLALIALLGTAGVVGPAAPAMAQTPEPSVAGYDHVVVVLDGSGSMSEAMAGGQTRMAAARTALETVLLDLPDTTRVGVLCFTTSARDPWLYELGPLDKDRLATAIAEPRPGGRTPLGAFIKAGADALLEERDRQNGYGTYRLLVVTDGEATDADKMVRYAPEVVSRGLGLDVIGVSMQEDHTLKDYAHAYRSADDPDTLVQAVQQSLAEVTFDGGDATADDAFAFLDGLPDDFAMAALQALSETHKLNHPLGTRPPKPAPPPPPAPTAPSSTQAATPPTPPRPTPDPGGCAVPGRAAPGLLALALGMLGLARRSR